MATNVPQMGAPSLSLVPISGIPNPLYRITLATVILCSSLTTIFTAARLVTKYLTARFGIEDYLLFLAWVGNSAVMNIIFEFLFLAAVLAGVGRHVWDVQVSSYAELAKFSWALEMLYSPCIWLAKASLIFQLIRIFTPMKSGAVYWACHALIWANLAVYIAVTFTILFECHPIDATWNPSLGSDCIDRNLVLVISAAVNVFSDLLNILLPIWAIWHLQMAPGRKIGLTAVFATGLLYCAPLNPIFLLLANYLSSLETNTISNSACASSICRLVYSIRTLFDVDISYITGQVGLWGTAEVAAIILCACLPMMPRLARHISESRAKSGSNSSRWSLRRRDWFGGSENKDSGNGHGSGSREEEMTGRDDRSEPAQQNWNPIKEEQA